MTAATALSDAPASPVSYDPTRYADNHDPYPTYRRLRDEAPLHWAPDLGCWIVSRYDDVMHVLKSPQVYSSRAMFTMLMNGGRSERPTFDLQTIGFLVRVVTRCRMNPFGFFTARNLIAEDGERHSALRAVVNRGFTPRRIRNWETRIDEVASGLARQLHGADAFDVVQDLAVPLPVTIIAEMLGVEPEHTDQFKEWSDGIVRAISGSGRDGGLNREAQEVFLGFTSYLRDIADARRREPKDDLVSVIVASQDSEAALSVREVVQFALLLMLAGNETTTNLITNGCNALLDHPDQLERVAADPALLPGLIEESLRFDSPIQLLFRNATVDQQLHGQTIRRGDNVGVLLGSANRDERRFADPDRFDVGRDTQGHVAFGFGHHFCLGASLARLEATAAFERIVPELARYERAAGEPERVDSFLVRGLRTLPIQRVA